MGGGISSAKLYCYADVSKSLNQGKYDILELPFSLLFRLCRLTELKDVGGIESIKNKQPDTAVFHYNVGSKVNANRRNFSPPRGKEVP